MALECFSLRHGMEVRLGEVLYSYYLKEHDKEKGRFQLTLRREMSLLVTCLWSNDWGWKNKYFFAKGKLVYGLSGSKDVASYWKTTSGWVLYV